MAGHKPWKLLLVVLGIGLIATACPSGGDGGTQGQAADSNLLDDVTSRGSLNCGVNNAVPGFGFTDEQGAFSGFDVDYCKAVAAGVLGDSSKVEFTALTAEQRFTALQGGEIDVLIRNTTWTATRDGSEGAAFATTTFYDGQGMMVRADSKFRKVDDMGGTTICVLSGTTTELNLATQFGARNLAFEPLSFRDNDTLQQNFAERRCDGWTSDKSQLAGIRSNWPADQGGPAALRVLPDTLSKEPLGPVVRDGDTRWFDAVNWVVIATIQAEEFGITQANVDQIRSTSTDPEVRRFLGLPPEEGKEALDPKFGLPVDFAYQVVKQVGNYGEIYNRNVGPDTPLGLPRGQNDLWTSGGLLYAPPYR